jgi:hypothetical protein
MGYSRAGSQSLTRARGSTFIRSFPSPVRPVRHQSKRHAIVVVGVSCGVFRLTHSRATSGADGGQFIVIGRSVVH